MTDYGTTIYDALDAARRSHPYYAGALGNLRMQEDRAVPTMATSAQWVTHFNPDTLRTWTAREAGAALVHELEHLLRKHHERCADRDPGEFNVAGDIEINQRLDNLPAGALYPESIPAPRGLSAERYYAIRNAGRKPESKPEPGEGEPGEGESGTEPGEGSGEGAGDGTESGEGAGDGTEPGEGSGTASCGSAAGGPTQPHEQGDSKAPGRGAYDDGEAARKDAAERILGGGITPGTEGAAEAIEWAEAQLGIDRAAWYTALASAVGKALAPFGAPTRWVWPGRRDHRDMGGAVLPRWSGTRPQCAVVIDTSSSITPADMDIARTAAHFLGRAADVTYYTCNTYATNIGRTLPESLIGRGGTDLRRGIAMAIAEGARCVVVITDCGTDWPTEYDGIPVIVGANLGAQGILDAGPGSYYHPPEWYTIVPLVSK